MQSLYDNVCLGNGQVVQFSSLFNLQHPSRKKKKSILTFYYYHTVTHTCYSGFTPLYISVTSQGV